MAIDEQNPDSDTLADERARNAISIVQRGNLKTLEKTLRRQWRLGQNIVLCWSADERGLLVIFVPHYFLGNYCASGEEVCNANEAFIRELISGYRRKTRDELFEVCDRLEVAPTFIKLSTALAEEERVLEAVEQLVRRYGLSYVQSRAVLLFDIVEFSLFTPFEQASQLNSLSYSLNSAYNKLLARGIEINFARTTTGDGYYIWNRDLGPDANRDLFYFMLLVVADNAVARAASHGNTVPVIRTGYHIDGHYELYQAEGVNPTVFSYIVGDVTIELARMLAEAAPDQVLIGDFLAEPHEGAIAGKNLRTDAFVNVCDRGLQALVGTQLSGKSIGAISCHLSAQEGASQDEPALIRIIDKHGLSHHAYNLQLEIDLDGRQLSLGLDSAPQETEASCETTVPVQQSPTASSQDMIDDLASLLQKRRNTGSTD